MYNKYFNLPQFEHLCHPSSWWFLRSLKSCAATDFWPRLGSHNFSMNTSADSPLRKPFVVLGFFGNGGNDQSHFSRFHTFSHHTILADQTETSCYANMSLHVCRCQCLQQWQTTSNKHKEWIGPVQLQFLRRSPSFIIQMSHGNESLTPAQSLRYQKAVEKDGLHEQKKPEHQCQAFRLAFPLLIPPEIGLNACAAFGAYFSWQNAQTALRTCRLVFPCKISSLSSCSMLFLLPQ